MLRHYERSALYTVALLVLASTASSCVTDPVTGKSRFSLVNWSPEEELELGKEAAPNVESQFDAIDPDPEANRRLGKLIGEMVTYSVRKDDFEFRFKILNSSIPNAFALPGGFVYITRGLLELLESEGQFISVMGHELGHVEHQHSMSNQSRGRFTGVLTAPFRGVAALTRGLPGGKVVGLAAGVAVAPLAIWGLKYDRGQELEADERGVFFSAEMGYDPREGMKTFETFERLEKESGGASAPSWLRTHPLNDARIGNIEKIIARNYPELLKKPESEFREASPDFEAVLDRFKQQAPAYALYDEAMTFITDPEVTPADFEKAEKNLEKAHVSVPDEPLFLIAKGEAALVKEHWDLARPYFVSALALYNRLSPSDSHWKAHFYLGVVKLHAKEPQSAIKDLEAARRLFPLNPSVHFFLGQAYEASGDRDAARAAYRQTMDLSPPDSETHREARVKWRKL